MDSYHWLEGLCCPSCHGQLQDKQCTTCGETYNSVLGIPDLRWPRPVANPKEAALVSEILARYPTATFKELAVVRFQTSQTPERLLSVYRGYHANLQERGDHMVRMFRQRLSANYPLPGQTLALDIGCGVGTSITALAQEFEWVIGLDPFLPNLLLARKFFQEQGVENVILVRAYAQHIPLRNDCVDYAVAQNVIEHLLDVEPAFHELRRVLGPGGCFCGDSRNRFDLFFPEPHAQLRWVGFLPRRLQSWYVRKFRNIPYSTTQLLSLGELQRLARRAFGKSARVVFPFVSAYGQSSRWDKMIKRLERIPVIREAMLAIFPSHLLLAQAE
ncbi:MAG: methyltransferase domain-containing protein [Chloroflexi bacterium]|nr:methyltransferase domain-containing protein [Chloroflexota bacterium]